MVGPVINEDRRTQKVFFPGEGERRRSARKRNQIFPKLAYLFMFPTVVTLIIRHTDGRASATQKDADSSLFWLEGINLRRHVASSKIEIRAKYITKLESLK